MRSVARSFVLAIAASIALVGCAGDGTNVLTTGTVPQQKKVAAAVDPACLALQNRIALLRSEGTVGRVEKAASGKSKNVVVRRAALGKVAELNQANSEFQARCSKLPVTAMVAPKPAPTAQAGAAVKATAVKAQAVKAAAVQARTTAAAVKKK